MKYLVDTSVALMASTEMRKLNSKAVALLSSATSILYFSSASVWEIAVRYALGNLPLHAEPAVAIPEMIRAMRMHALPITHTHAIEAGRLPRYHDDPFDRVLIAQTQIEGMTLLTSDRMVRRYNVEHVFCAR
jgi:PIN domain nuclease of toxin-antitoxin system